MSKSASLSIPFKEGRRTSDPTNPNRYSFVGLAPIGEALKFQIGSIPWVNPRHPNPKSKMARVIKSSVFENRGKFHLLNRGVTVIAEDGKLEQEFLNTDFGSATKRGLIDGGTTVGALVDALKDGFTQNSDKEETQYFRVQVFCGRWTDEEVVDLAEALNTSVQVDSFSIANLAGEFEWIKGALKRHRPAFKVSYFTNDESEIGVDDIVQWLALFMMDEPHTAYSSKEKCLEHFEANITEYKKCEGVLLDLIKLSEYVPFQSKVLYNASGNHKFGRLGIIADSTKGSTYKLPVLGETIDYAPHKAWVFPLLASLKPLLDKSCTPFKWRKDPFKVFDKLSSELVSKVNRSYGSLQTFNAVGKNPDLYELLMEKVENTL
ncbi:MAG TPA: AIPR family protein [Candidatus Dormibacteraeota bacterium]|nr:AIPR family protein [Candidatus Dormibacteraeota bacterium]